MHFISRLGRWLAELVLVFVGVYAAFWLNNYQQHQQDAKRRDQILASLEQEFLKGIESGKIAGAKEERQAAEFRRALDAGEMPLLHPFVFTTDYSPGDIATLLQSGGVELLDVKTLMAFARTRIRYSLGPWRYAALPEIERRGDRAESRSGYFLLLRSRHQEIAKTFLDLSPSFGSNCEIRSRPGANQNRVAQANSNRTARRPLL